MALASGTKLGHYEIREQIGQGGMGEVYRARDTRLGRDVAVKISTREFNERFERETHAISSLNHPNICTLHDIGSSPEVAGYLVMEFVDGVTLSAILARGPLPLGRGQWLDRGVFRLPERCARLQDGRNPLGAARPSADPVQRGRQPGRCGG